MDKHYFNIIFIIFLISLCIIGALCSGHNYIMQKKNNTELSDFLKGEKDLYPIKKRYQSAMNPELSASLISLIDKKKEKKLFGQNIHTAIPMASITKLMTAVVVLDNYNLEDKITIDEDVIKTDGDPKKLVQGDVYTVKNLLYIMLIESNNEAAEAFAKKIDRNFFISEMNKKAQLFKMENTKYLNPTGLDIDNQEDTNTTSPNDIKILVINIIDKYPLIVDILSRIEYNTSNEDGIIRNSQNTNTLLQEDKDFLWGKTGFTLKAKGCLVVISRPPNFSFFENKYIINIIMGAKDRFEQAKYFKSWTANQFIW